jgi:hypothetical protein
LVRFQVGPPESLQVIGGFFLFTLPVFSVVYEVERVANLEKKVLSLN